MTVQWWEKSLSQPFLDSIPISLFSTTIYLPWE
jgi:hypothetical protein